MIDIRTFTVPKNNGNGSISIKVNGGGGGSASSLKPLSLWGQYFDGTEDISGDISNVGNLFANGTLYAPYFNCSGKIDSNQLTVGYGSIEDLTATTTHYGEWTVSATDDELSDLIIGTSTSGHTMRIVPNSIDVIDIDETKVHVNKKLDLTNQDEGSNIVMGTETKEADNTNFKSIVEEGFYICDNDNNVAIGISNNYIQCGADIGSPNFYSGLQGWRVQPDGTGEFQNLKVNGNLDVFVLTYNEMRATNGILLVTDCGCINDAVESEIDGKKYWIFTIDEFPPFAIDDYVQLQYRVDEGRIFSFKGIVTAINQDGKNTVRVLPLSGFHGQGTSTDDRGVTTFATVDAETASGEYLIRIGNKTDKNRQTIIKLNPYAGGYIDFMKGLNNESSLAPSTNAPTATRVGNLSGIVYKGTTLEGYGLFSDNAYLTGAIKNLSDKWSLNADGSGQVAGGHISWDSKGNLSIKLGETEITEYISNISNELDGKISTTKTELSGQISATASGLTADYSSKIQTVQNNVDTVSGNLASNYSTTTQMNSSIQASASALTTTFNTKIQTVQSNVNTVSGNLASNYSTTTQMNSAIQASASALTTTFNTKIDTVQNNVNSVSGNLASNYSTTTQMNSAIQASASGVTSSVNKTINEKYTDLNGKITTAKSELSSEISQTASNIKLEVKNDLNTTGIDITNHKIKINADDTTIIGNLKLERADNGLTLYDSYSKPRVKVIAKTTDEVASEDDDSGEGITSWATISSPNMTSFSKWQFPSSSSQANSATVTTSNDILIRNIDVDMSIYYGSSQHYCGSPTLDITMVVKSDDGEVNKTYTMTAYKRSDGKHSCGSGIHIATDKQRTYTFSVSATTNYNSDYSWATRDDFSYWKTIIVIDYYYNNHLYTALCTNGMLSKISPRQCLKLDNSDFYLRNNCNGLKISSDSEYSGGIHVLTQGNTINNKEVWLPMYNFTPTTLISGDKFDYGTVTNTGDLTYFYNINPITDVGILWMKSPVSGASNCMFVLPPSTFKYNGETVDLPIGYTVTIANHQVGYSSKSNVFVTPSVSTRYHGFMVDDNDQENYFCALNSSNGHMDKYVYLGIMPKTIDGISYQCPFWMTLKDTQ